MKILYFYQYFATPAGAWGTRAYEFARRWAEAGDEVTIVTGVYDKSDLTVGRGLVSRHRIDGVDVRVVNVEFSNKHSIVKRLYSFLTYALVSCWYALVRDADVVVASSGPATIAIPATVARVFRGRPVVFEVRDLWPDVLIEMGLLRGRFGRWVAEGFIAFCYRMSSRVVALSPGMKEWIERDYPGTLVSVVPNAADPHLFEGTGEEDDEETEPARLALFTGTIGRANNCEQILDAARELRDRGRDDVRVVLIGDGSERLRLEEEARESGLTNVEFRDPMPKTELVQWVRRSSCLLLVLRPIPVFDTSSPNKLFDAFAAGRPIVQTTRGWIYRLVREEECGVNVAPGVPGEMADAIERLVDDPSLNRRLSENARRMAARFARPRLAAEMRRVLGEVGEN